MLPVFITKEIRQTFRSLKYRNLRIFFIGQIVSLSCTWMQIVALSWLVYRLTRSPIMLGIVEGSSLLPVLLFGLAGGALADRVNRRTVMITTQSLALIQATVLAYLTISGLIQVWHCVVLALFLGTVNAFENPSRQAMVVNMVRRADLVNAVSLGSSIFNVARSVGPALAGIIVARTSEGICFAINAVSYLAALGALLMLRIESTILPQAERQKSEFFAGLRFAFSQPTVRGMILLSAAISLFGFQVSVVMPIFASEILGGGVETLGLLRALNGAGALAAALTLASRGHGGFLRFGVGVAAVFYGLSLIFFSMSGVLWISAAIMLVAGFCLVSMLSGGHSMIQLAVSDQLRGRVMSVYTTVLLGFAPIGSLLIGWLASEIGASQALLFNATVVVLAGVVYLFALVASKVSEGIREKPDRVEVSKGSKENESVCDSISDTANGAEKD